MLRQLPARAAPGIEPGTSRTLSENHATRPSNCDFRSFRMIRAEAVAMGEAAAGRGRGGGWGGLKRRTSLAAVVSKTFMLRLLFQFSS